jgi:hypothetical protein
MTELLASAKDALEQMDLAFNGMKTADGDHWPAAERMRKAIEACESRNSTAPHNVVRFDLCLAYVSPMIQGGEIDMQGLIQKVEAAIVETVNTETEWDTNGSQVNATGGNGNSELPLHDEEITWDFS